MNHVLTLSVGIRWRELYLQHHAANTKTKDTDPLMEAQIAYTIRIESKGDLYEPVLGHLGSWYPP